MNQKYLIIANWKMNPVSPQEAQRLFEAIKQGMPNVNNAEVVICPPFVWLSNLDFGEEKSKLQLGAQDCFWEERGAFTGEVSPLMLKNLGCQYVIVGHSETRALGETNEMINKKIHAALRARLKPILCIGEKEEEKEQIKEILESQLIEGLKEISPEQMNNLVIAYEPVWAISTGNFCSVDDALPVCLMIRKFLFTHYNQSLAETSRILYGGSVDSKNAFSYIKEARMNGLLVGNASLNANEFIKIINSVEQ